MPSIFFKRVGALLPACILTLYCATPLFSQTGETGPDSAVEESFYDDDILLMEDDQGITVVETPETT
ncbi:MAG: hypothetical protein LBP76_12300 [Treponema sp.]|jgi:hypothetical protein|nr:hypothetical protein [Treponema sp.]